MEFNLRRSYSFQTAGEFNSDFVSFWEEEEIGDAQRSVEEELVQLDDNFLSSEPILHQSPFTKLARERSPVLDKLLDGSHKISGSGINNPFFSRELIKIFYKWIAYLPIFTGVMYRFYER